MWTRLDPPTSNELRVFATLQAAFVPAVAWVLAGRPTPCPPWLVGVAAVAVFIGIVGWFKPSVAATYLAVWTKLFYPIQWVVSRALLAVVYYLVLTPIGLIVRALGVRPVQRGWVEKPDRPISDHLWRLW